MVRVESLARSGFPQGPFHSRPWPRMLALMSGYVTGLRSPRWAPLAWLRDLREDLSSLPTQRGHQPPTPVGCVILSSHFLSLGLFFPRAGSQQRHRGEAPAGTEWACVPTGLPSILDATVYMGVRSQQDTGGLGCQAWVRGCGRVRPLACVCCVMFS